MDYYLKYLKYRSKYFNLKNKNIDETTEEIFRKIKSRNYLINDFGVLRANLDRTDENHIVKP